MRLDDLTLAEFEILFRDLVLGHQRTIPDDDFGPTMQVYYRVARVFPTAVVERAITLLVETPSRYFPKAGDLAAKCRELDRDNTRRLPSPPSGDETHRCPSCGVPFQVVGYECGNGVVVGRQKCGCPQGGEGWDTPSAKAYVDPFTSGQTIEAAKVAFAALPTEDRERIAAKKAAFRAAVQETR